MKPYKFSPIHNKDQLIVVLQYIHKACHKLCDLFFGEYLPVAGNIGVFCHYDYEYKLLKSIQQEICEMTDSFNQKYFKLKEPITMPRFENMPKSIYTYLYIRQPDTNRPEVGDLDFYLDPEEYLKLKQSLLDGTSTVKGASVLNRTDLDMVQLDNPDIDALAFVSTHEMTKKVRVRQ